MPKWATLQSSGTRHQTHLAQDTLKKLQASRAEDFGPRRGSSYTPAMARPLLALAGIALAAVLAASDVAFASRPPTSSERSAIRQALFDHFFASKFNVFLYPIRVSTVKVPPRGILPLQNYAVVTIEGTDSAGASIGTVTALLGRFVKPTPGGWRMRALGSSDVGCARGRADWPEPWYGRMLTDLRLTCAGRP